MTTLTYGLGSAGDLLEAPPRTRRELRELAERAAAQTARPAVESAVASSSTAGAEYQPRVLAFAAAERTAADSRAERRPVAQPAAPVASRPVAQPAAPVASRPVAQPAAPVEPRPVAQPAAPALIQLEPLDDEPVVQARRAQAPRVPAPVGVIPMLVPDDPEPEPEPFVSAPAPVEIEPVVSEPEEVVPEPSYAAVSSFGYAAPFAPTQHPGGSAVAIPAPYSGQVARHRAAVVGPIGFMLVATVTAASLQYFEIVDVLGLIGR